MNNFKPPQDIIAICEKYSPKYFDTYCRITSKPFNGRDYEENAAQFSALFCAILWHVDPASAQKYYLYFRDEIQPLCEALKHKDILSPYSKDDEHHYRWHSSVLRWQEVIWSRQPYGQNFYPTDHPEYDVDLPWNVMSKDEIIGHIYFADKRKRQLLVKFLEQNKWVYNDWNILPSGKLFERFRHPLSARYLYKKAAGYKPSIFERIAFNASFYFGTYIKKDNDSILKNYLRGEIMNEQRISVEQLKDAMEYFDDGENFKRLAREL